MEAESEDESDAEVSGWLARVHRRDADKAKTLGEKVKAPREESPSSRE